MNKSQLRLRACALACAGIGSVSVANGAPEFRTSGFGSLIATQVDTDGIEYVNPGQTSGAGRSASFKNDSRLGVQFDAKLSDRFSGTVQLLAKHSGEGNSGPGVEWAFAKARLVDGLTLRAGRLGAPFFAVSDVREVGYANTWLRTPTPVYGQNFLRSFDGVDLSYDGSVAGKSFTVQLLAGGTTVPFTRTDIDYKRQVGVNATLELIDGLVLRLGTVNGKLTVQSESMKQLVDTLAATPFASVGQQIDCTDRKASFSGVGLTLDRGNWVGAAEYTQRRTACYVPDTTGWHLMAGYRVGSFTPYAIVAEVKRDDTNVVNSIPVGLSPTLTFLADTVDGLVDSVAVEHSSVAIGVRWDAWRNTAVKLQWERIDTKNGAGMFRLVGAKPTEPVNALSVGVDFVF